jgi:hypothetical protein
VHYIFVDRTTNRVRAPTISPLHGQVNRDAAATERMLEKLRHETRQLVHNAQEHLAQGFTSMLVRKNDFLYSYRLWVEDDEGVGFFPFLFLPLFFLLPNAFTVQ